MKHSLFGFGCSTLLIVFAIPLKQPDFSSFTNIQKNLMAQDTIVPVKVQLEKANFNDMPVLFIKDTAATTEALQGILGKGYGELMSFIQQKKLKPLKFMAWYYTVRAPWSLDIAIETDRVPAQPGGPYSIKNSAGRRSFDCA